MAMTPTDLLREEHRVILKALDVLEAALGRDDAPAQPAWSQLIEWLRGFADRTHHAREEEALFPAMAAAGVPVDGGPIGVMLAEHEEGRALIRAMAEGGVAERAAAGRRYVVLLRQHIDKENGVLFMIADAVLAGDAMAGVARSFERITAVQGRTADIPTAEAALAEIAAALGRTGAAV